MAEEFHPFLVFSRPGELIVVLGDDMYQRNMTAVQLLNLGRNMIDTATYMLAEQQRTEDRT